MCLGIELWPLDHAQEVCRESHQSQNWRGLSQSLHVRAMLCWRVTNTQSQQLYKPANSWKTRLSHCRWFLAFRERYKAVGKSNKVSLNSSMLCYTINYELYVLLGGAWRIRVLRQLRQRFSTPEEFRTNLDSTKESEGHLLTKMNFSQWMYWNQAFNNSAKWRLKTISYFTSYCKNYTAPCYRENLYSPVLSLLLPPPPSPLLKWWSTDQGTSLVGLSTHKVKYYCEESEDGSMA